MRTSLFPWMLIYSLLLIKNRVFGQCLGSQQSLLLQLKNSLNFDLYWSDKLVTWNASNDCCSWKGVLCDDQGYVSNLDLSNEGISGELDNPMISLLTLHNLKSIDLSFNQGRCWIKNLTAIVKNFPNLEELFLDLVNISASGTEWGPALSSSLPNLRALSLSDCHLFGPLDDSLSNLRSLSLLHLQGNNLSSPVPQSFAKLSNLTSLKLYSCGLSGTFPKAIFQVQALQTIDISKNEFLHGTLPEFPLDSSLRYIDLSHTKYSGTLPISIGNLRNLSTLFIHNCQFNGTIPSSMEKLTQLFYVALSSNSFTGSVPSFTLAKNLSRLYLSDNSLTGEISSTHWGGLKNLEQLVLSNNSLTGNIPLGLFSLLLLETIELSNNRFIGSIPEFEISSSPILNTLNLSYNILEGFLPNSVFKLKNLIYFDLSYNNFNGTVDLSLFQGLGKLILLDLSYNKWSVVNSTDNSFPTIRDLVLSSCDLKTFPLLKNMNALVYLDLSNNRISGEIPNSIWELGDLRFSYLNLSHNYLEGFQKPYYLPNSLNVLDLHFNNLRGNIPILPPYIHYLDLSSNRYTSIPIDIFKGFIFLGFFSLSNNSLSGTIPESICNTSMLQVLDLSHNSLNGEIPKCLINTSDYSHILNLRNNNFSGPIPDTFPAGCGLKALDFNGNSFLGEIPKSLSNCSSLNILDLGHNVMSGKFPCFLRKMSALRVLILRSNKFRGSLECPEKNEIFWPEIQIFDVAHNELSGELSSLWAKKFKGIMETEASSKSEVLGYSHGFSIQYSHSSLVKEKFYQYKVTMTFKGQEMEIPKILTIFTCIDVSSNDFHGKIPSELGQLKALYVLNMSNNALVGQIPSSFGDLQGLESLDLSLNDLTGTIPESLGDLNFLQFLNLSFNQLVGEVPKGSQIQTFSEDSFIGNEGLCGSPLKRNCSSEETTNSRPNSGSNNNHKLDWNFLSAEIGFIIGFGIVVAPLVFSRRWRKWHFDRIDDIVIKIFPSSLARKWFLWT